MDCSEVSRLIPAYCRGELDDEQRRQVEEHLANCSDCRDEVHREQLLCRALNDQAVDDPPQDYWHGYNDRLRSRARAAVGVLWGLGCLPGAIAGLLFGIIIGMIVFSSVFGGLYDRIGLTGMVIITLIIALCIGLAFRSVYKRVNIQISRSFKTEESDLKWLIQNNPAYRRTFLIASSLFWIAVSAIISLMQVLSAAYVPIIARVLLAIVVFFGVFISCEIETLRYMQSDNGRPRPLWYSRVLVSVAFAALMGVNIWEMKLSQTVRVPSVVTRQANSAYSAGDKGSAIAMLRACIEEHPSSPHVLRCYELLGSIYKGSGQQAQAQTVYREGIKAYESLLTHPHYNYTKPDRISMTYHAANLYDGLGNERKADELRRLSDTLAAE